jgi:hypothetical protein
MILPLFPETYHQPWGKIQGSTIFCRRRCALRNANTSRSPGTTPAYLTEIVRRIPGLFSLVGWRWNRGNVVQDYALVLQWKWIISYVLAPVVLRVRFFIVNATHLATTRLCNVCVCVIDVYTNRLVSSLFRIRLRSDRNRFAFHTLNPPVNS